MSSREFSSAVPVRLRGVVEVILFETIFLKGQLSKDPGQSADWSTRHARLRIVDPTPFGFVNLHPTTENIIHTNSNMTSQIFSR
jgi:hypothetical protein